MFPIKVLETAQICENIKIQRGCECWKKWLLGKIDNLYQQLTESEPKVKLKGGPMSLWNEVVEEIV